MQRSIQGLLIWLCLLFSADAGNAASFFTGIGGLSGSTIDSQALAVSNNGVVVGSGTQLVPIGGFPVPMDVGAIWTHAGGIQALPNDFRFAVDVSHDGSVVVGHGSGMLRWTQAGGVQQLGGNLASAVSADGSVVVGYLDTPNQGGRTAARWTEAGGLQEIIGVRSRAHDVSSDGTVVLASDTSAVEGRPVLWTFGAGSITLTPPGAGPSVRGLSPDGSTVLLSVLGDAWKWTAADGFVALGDVFPAGETQFPEAATTDGSIIVGGGFGSAATSTAFIWDAQNGMRELATVLTNDYGFDLTGWTLKTANDISPNGRWLVGTGINPLGNREGFVAFLPEPGAGAFLTIVLVASARLRLARAGRASPRPSPPPGQSPQTSLRQSSDLGARFVRSS